MVDLKDINMKNSVKAYRNIARNNQISSGHFMKPKTQWFKDKSKYTRKQKHKCKQKHK